MPNFIELPLLFRLSISSHTMYRDMSREVIKVSGQYIIVSSITYAYKGKKILERKGIRASVERAPTEISECGCHYAIRIGNASLDRAIRILDHAHIKIISVGGGNYGIS